MGNVNLHLLTTAEDQILRIELEDFDGEKRYAEYSTFRVSLQLSISRSTYDIPGGQSKFMHICRHANACRLLTVIVPLGKSFLMGSVANGMTR